MRVTFEQLPPELKKYAEGLADYPRGQQFSNDEVMSARWYRMRFLRQLQHYLPGKQWEWPDYWELMGDEITNYARRILRPQVIKKWEKLAESSPDFGQLYTSYEKRFQPKAVKPMTDAQKRRLELQVKYAVIDFFLLDPRRLGIMETVVTGRSLYGLPVQTHKTER